MRKYPIPWCVTYRNTFPAWHKKSLPYIHDANGLYICHPEQTVDHPGLYDKPADDVANHIVRCVNNHDKLLSALQTIANLETTLKEDPEQIGEEAIAVARYWINEISKS